jgi:uracil-DNA glycosylase
MPVVATPDAANTLADWWEAMGVTVDRDALVPKRASPPPKTEASAPALPRSAAGLHDAAFWVAHARAAAAACHTMDALKAAIAAFEGCPLKAGADNTVICDGQPGAALMVIGEGPGAEEDRTGLPFVGRAGQLLDKMLAAIGRSRATNTLITNVNYWRPPGNRNPEADELAVCRPFVDRMIALNAPKLIVAAGGVPATALLASKEGIMKLRGKEFAFTLPGGETIPLIPLLHPAYLLRRPQDKSRAWRDLLEIEKRLTELGA